MSGYRVHHGLPLDAKLTVIARNASLSRAEVLALWIVVMDHASRNDPRGSAAHIDAEEIAALLDIAPDKAVAGLAGFYKKRMITQNGMIAGWDRAQYSSTPRVQAMRERRRRESQRPLDPDTPDEIARRRARLGARSISKHPRHPPLSSERRS